MSYSPFQQTSFSYRRFVQGTISNYRDKCSESPYKIIYDNPVNTKDVSTVFRPLSFCVDKKFRAYMKEHKMINLERDDEQPFALIIRADKSYRNEYIHLLYQQLRSLGYVEIGDAFFLEIALQGLKKKEHFMFVINSQKKTFNFQIPTHGFNYFVKCGAQIYHGETLYDSSCLGGGTKGGLYYCIENGDNLSYPYTTQLYQTNPTSFEDNSHHKYSFVPINYSLMLYASGLLQANPRYNNTNNYSLNIFVGYHYKVKPDKYYACWKDCNCKNKTTSKAAENASKQPMEILTKENTSSEASYSVTITFTAAPTEYIL